MNQIYSNNNQNQNFKLGDMIPIIGLLIMSYSVIHSFQSSNYDELVNLRDQSWKIINIDVAPPYRYKIEKMKYEYRLNIYDGNSEIYSTKCSYSTTQLCKDEFPVSHGKIKKFEFYKSSNEVKSNLSTILRIKSIQYLDQNNQLQSISLKAKFPNTKQAIKKQKWKLGFSTFIAVWFMVLLAYLNSFCTLIPLFIKQLLYIFIAGNTLFIFLKTLMILI